MRINCDIKQESNIGVREEQKVVVNPQMKRQMVFKVSGKNRPQMGER